MKDKVQCQKCGKLKEHFAKGMCKKCYNREYYKKHREYYASLSIKSKINIKCPLYLGVHIAEKVLSYVFKDVEKMVSNNPGFDFICNKGKKVDVKASCRRKHPGWSDWWKFNINYNKTADYFLCIAFDNRIDLNPEYLWLIPGIDISNYSSTSITESKMNKWKKYEINKKLDEVIICCNTIKNNKNGDI